MLITSFQIFILGLGMAAAGPCLVTCLPLILAYTTGTDTRFFRKLLDISLFLCGRLSAYVLLGALAGISGSALSRVVAPSATAWLRPAAGAISIALGVLLLTSRKAKRGCRAIPAQPLAAGGLFLVGFIIGVSPCGPLLALLSEIVLISRSVWDGVWYGFVFGLGTFISTLILAAGASGIIHWIPRKYAASPAVLRLVRLVCALSLIGMGAILVIR